jgi:hypothetical protein
MRLLIIVILLVGSLEGMAQSRKKSKEIMPDPAPNSLNPTMQPQSSQKRVRKTDKNSPKGLTYNTERNYYNRIEQLKKEKIKNERLLEKPQYSDPMYFGHKRPPKKRPPSKMKFCKECGIRH